MPILLILFIVVPVVELAVIIKVGQLIGLWPTLALILASAITGTLLLRSQGRGAWRRFNEALGQRRFPGKEVADGALIIVGGTLLLTPGFITDITGILLLLPPTRAITRRGLRRFFVGRFTVVGVGGFPGGGSGQGAPWRPGEPGARGGSDAGGEPGRANRRYDYDVTAEEEPGEGEGELPRADNDA